MFNNLPEKWKRQLENEFSFVQKSGFYLTNPSEGLKIRVLGVLLDFDLEVKKQIYKFVQKAIPEKILPKLHIQPYQGYHCSIQTSSQKAEDEKKLASSIEKLYKNSKPLKGNIKTIYPSDNSLFGVTTLNGKLIAKMRLDLSEIFLRCGAQPKYNPKRDKQHFDHWSGMTWISLARPTEAFSEEELKLLRKLAKKEFKNVSFNKIVLTYNDQFFTPGVSEILTEINLK